MRYFRNVLTLLCVLMGGSDAQAQPKVINYFHLQDESGAMRAKVRSGPYAGDLYLSLGLEHILSILKGYDLFWETKVGLGKFVDKSFHPLVVLVGLTDYKKARAAFYKEFPLSWVPLSTATKKSLSAIDWLYDDTNLHESRYVSEKRDHLDDPRGCLEPLIWVATRLPWDEGPHVTRYISISVAGLPHYKGDGSWADREAATNLHDFSEDEFPASDKTLWPPGLPFTQTPPLATKSRYADLGLVKRVLAYYEITLQVYYGLDNNGYTPRKAWLYVLERIGVAPDALIYWPQILLPSEVHESGGYRADDSLQTDLELATTSSGTTTSEADTIASETSDATVIAPITSEAETK